MSDQPRIRVIPKRNGTVSVEAEDGVTFDEIVDFLDLDYPMLAQKLQRIADIAQEINEPDRPFWRS